MRACPVTTWRTPMKWKCMMNVTVNARPAWGNAHVISLAGEIDVFTAPKVNAAILAVVEKAHYRMVIDLEDVQYIDSTGLGVLIGNLKRVRDHGGALLLVCTSPAITKLFEITGLSKVFAMFRDEQSALRALPLEAN